MHVSNMSGRASPLGCDLPCRSAGTGLSRPGQDQRGPVTQVPQTLRTVADLRAAGLLPHGSNAEVLGVAARYAVAITPDMAALIDRADPHDPIARQFVPDVRELDHKPEERADPIGDEAHSPVPGVVHRYPDRVLLKLTHVCPVYCRFCFRREVVGPGGPQALSDQAIEAAVAYIASDAEHLGSDPHRRRSVHAVAAPHRRRDRAAVRDSAREDPALAYARAGRRSCAHHS